MITYRTLSLKLSPSQSFRFIIEKYIGSGLFFLCSLMALFTDLETTELGACVYSIASLFSIVTAKKVISNTRQRIWKMSAFC